MLGPLETIGATIVNNDGPTGDYRPNIPPATLGPLEPIGNIPCEECWANSKPSVRSLPNHTGPIGDHRQNSTGNAGPIGDRRPNIPPATLGPLEPIGNIPCEECWANSKPSVRSLPNHTGPIGDHRQNSTGNAGPIGDRRPNIPPATLGPLEPIGNIPCEECWANSKPSARSLPNHTGPIGDHRQNFTSNAGPIGDHRPNIPPHQQRWAHLSPSVISHVKNAGPIQSHRYVHFPIVLGPLEIIDKILPATLGPLTIIGQIFHQKRWAHLSPSVISLVKNAGPIQSHRYVHFPIVLGPLEIIDKIPPATLGLLVIIGQIFHWQRWAHLSPSVISLVKNAGPIESHRYVHFPIVLGPLEIIDKILPATPGPLVIIGQIFHHQRWAHLSPSVRSLPNRTGPIGDHRQNIPLAMLGPLETIGATIVNNDGPTGDYRPNIPLATLGPFEPIGNIPCEECWAHSKPSVRSLPNHTGPIGDHRQNSTGNAGPIGDRRPNIPPA